MLARGGDKSTMDTCEFVRFELNGKPIGEDVVDEAEKIFSARKRILAQPENTGKKMDIAIHDVQNDVFCVMSGVDVPVLPESEEKTKGCYDQVFVVKYTKVGFAPTPEDFDCDEPIEGRK